MDKSNDIDKEKIKEMSLEVERMMEFIQSKKVYKCSYPGCKAYFERPYRLAQHLLAHNNIRPYVCKQTNCDKSYTSKSHLDRHSRAVHMPQETDVVYSCDQCSQTFVSLYLKKRHMRYHKKYTCLDCRVEFNHWSKYQKHLKEDHKRDEFICNDCGRSFKKRCHIVRHVKIHAGNMKTFMCPYENCERSYSRNSNLKQHILVKHMDVLHECTICHSRLSTKAKLNYHLQLHSTTGTDQPPPRLINKERKERKDEGSFKTSTALKLAGLSKAPVNYEPSLSAMNEVHGEIRSSISMNENLNDSPQNAVTETPESHTKSPPLNLTVKTEYIEVEVDIPYDI